MTLSAYKDFEIITVLRSLLSTDSLLVLRKIENLGSGLLDSEAGLVENGYCKDKKYLFYFDPAMIEGIGELKKSLGRHIKDAGLPGFIVVKGIGAFSVAVLAKGLYPAIENGSDTLRDPGRMHNKVVIITGAAQGFGAGLAASFFEEGANVVIADLNDEKGEALTNELNTSGKQNRAHFISCDVSDLESVDMLVNRTALYFGGIDVMISNAGILIAGGLDEMTAEKFDLMTKVNYTGYFNCAKAASRLMKVQSSATDNFYYDILQINSKSGLKGSNRNFAYAGGKFGGIGLTQSFALELIPYRIKVNSICPGNFFEGPLWTDPEKGLFVQYFKAGKVKGAKTIEDVKRFYEMQVPAGRGCGIKDVSKAAFYAIEQEYETGQAIPVTGGQNMLK